MIPKIDIKRGDTVVCVNKLKLKIDSVNYMITDDINVGDILIVSNINYAYCKEQKIALSFDGKIYEHCIENFKKQI